MIFLKNYTSNVPVSDTIHRIEKVLLRCGVTGIMKEYGANAKVMAVTFRVETDGGVKQMIRLPANVERAQEALWLDYAGADISSQNPSQCTYHSRKKKTKKDFADQAERTAWKIIQDWVEVQMSMIQLKQADVLEVFLPYVFDGKTTYYNALKESNFAGLLTAGSEQ